MSVLDRITIDDQFLDHYWNADCDLVETRDSMMTIYKTNELVSRQCYPYLYALRQSNYNDNFTIDELKIIKEKTLKEFKKRSLKKLIAKLQAEIDELD